jgi:tetratricopeptide (TPR) repeat protein
MRGSHVQALVLLDEARAASAGMPRERVEHAQALTELALTHLALGDAARAAPLANDALAIFTEAQGPVTPARADALVALGRAYLALGRDDQARPLLEQAHGFWRGFAPDSRWARESGAWLRRTSRRQQS